MKLVNMAICRRDLAGFIERNWVWGIIGLLVLSAVVRLAVMVPRIEKLEDPDRYLVLAQAVVEGQGLAVDGRPTAYRPPLYPLILAGLIAAAGTRLSWGVAVLHLGLGGATVGFTAMAARRWGLAPARVLIVAGIVACDPVLVALSRSVMTETLAAFLIAATLAALALGGWQGAILGGLGFGLATLCRPSLLVASGLVTLAALVTGPGTAGVRLRRAGFVAMATVVVLLPWAWRNARVLGTPVWTTTHGGWTLALANNPVYYAEVLDDLPGAVWSGVNQDQWFRATVRGVEGLTEPEADQRIRADAIRFIADHPRDFVRACGARLGRFWALAPAAAVYSPSIRWISLVWTVPLWIGLILGLARRDLWRWPRVAAPAMVLALTLVHSVYWTDMRMRAPLVPALALIVGGAKIPVFWRRNLEEIHSHRSVN